MELETGDRSCSDRRWDERHYKIFHVGIEMGCWVEVGRRDCME